MFASDHGIYLQTLTKHKGNIDSLQNELAANISFAGFEILSKHNVAVPDLVREDSSEHCGAKAKLLVFTSQEYIDFLTSYDNKYLVASFLRAAVYSTPDGLNISIADPETINRIVFNDLWENDEVEKYDAVIAKTKGIQIKNSKSYSCNK